MDGETARLKRTQTAKHGVRPECEAIPQVPKGQNYIGHRAVRTRLKTNAAP
jgi:hypothetical protein